MRVQCPHCRTPCQVTPEQQGMAVKCAQCGQAFRVPAAAAPAPPPPPAPPEPAARPCRLDIGSATSPGRVRDRNEDRFIVQHLTWSDPTQYREIALVLVADGLGGHEAGDRAAAMVM